MSEIDSTIFGMSFGKLEAFDAIEQCEMAGAPCAITFDYNEETDSVDFMIAFPVMDVVDCEGTEFAYLEVPAAQSYVYKYYGEYREVGPGHYEMAEYLKINSLTQGDVVIEEYVTDTESVESYDNVLTNVRYLMK
jgi:effector-binding domain-containing protein